MGDKKYILLSEPTVRDFNINLDIYIASGYQPIGEMLVNMVRMDGGRSMDWITIRYSILLIKTDAPQ